MAEKKIIEVDVKTGKGFDDLKTKVEGVKKETKKTSEASQKLGSKLDSVTGGAVSKFKGMVTAIKSVNTGFNLMKLAIIGTGIGVLLIAILAVKKAFEASEEGQNKYAKILGVIGSITGNLMDLLTDLGELIISVFEDPKKAINDFANLIKDNIVNRFNGLLELMPQLGAAVQKLFEGDFSGAAKTAGNAVAKVTLGVDDLSGSIENARKKLKELSDEVADDARKAANIADNRAKADKLERDLIVERANANRKIADLRDKANNRELFSAQERIQFLKEASKISEDITDKEIKGAELRRDALVLENTLSKSNKEDMKAEEESKARVIDLDTQKLRLQKALTAQIQSLNSEASSANKARNEEGKKEKEQKEKEEKEEKAKNLLKEKELIRLNELKIESERKLSIERQRFNAEQIEDELLRLERLKEIDELEAEQESIRLQAIVDNANAGTQAKIDAQIALDEFSEQSRQQNITRDAEIADARENIRLQDLANEKAIVEAKKMLQYDLVNAISGAVGAIGNLFAKSTAASKTAALAEIAIQTGLGFVQGLIIAQKSAKATGPAAAFAFPIFYATQVAAVLSSVNKASGILSKVKGGGSGSRPSAPNIPTSSGGAAAPQAQAPSFNIVGQSSTDQLAGAIGGQEKQPLKAYVVSEDVTTAQQLDRNIIQGAAI